MEYMTIARPYSKAVFYIAKKSNSLDEWNDFLSFLSNIVSDPSISSIIKNRTINCFDKAGMIIELFEFTSTFDNDVKNYLVNFIKVLSYYGRLLCIKDIYLLYKQYMNIEKCSVEAIVKVPFIVSSAQKDDIVNFLSKRFDKKVSAIFEVDESLLGGFLVKTGDFVLDASIAGNLGSLGTKIML